ncbi:MAG: hypothetical protein ACI36W_06665 [Coriobacteriales bacterium]
MSEQQKRRAGTRCKVCRLCGRCFEDDSAAAQDAAPRFSAHKRCEVCLECGKCMEAWGLVLGGGGGEDGVSSATSLAAASALLEVGDSPPPPLCGASPGESSAGAAAQAAAAQASPAKRPCFAVLKKVDGMDDDATGATPGVASACKELGFSDLESVSARLGIKPPGQH